MHISIIDPPCIFPPSHSPPPCSYTSRSLACMCCRVGTAAETGVNTKWSIHLLGNIIFEVIFVRSHRILQCVYIDKHTGPNKGIGWNYTKCHTCKCTHPNKTIVEFCNINRHTWLVIWKCDGTLYINRSDLYFDIILYTINLIFLSLIIGESGRYVCW